MIQLDDRLRAGQAATREWAKEMRACALDLDARPDTVHDYLHLPFMAYMTTATLPPEYIKEPFRVGGYEFLGVQTLERTVVIEELAVGDPGLLLGVPGPSLAGAVVAALGDEYQKHWFYERLAAGRTWTFLGLTEPRHGSDAGAMETRFDIASDGSPGRLHGMKRYVGNAARAEVGVVFARTGPGPLGVVAVLVDTSEEGFGAEPIPTVGLRANQITTVRLDGVEVPAELVLGRHLSGVRRGMWGAVQGLSKFRPGVGALALGIARAACEYVREHRRSTTRDEEFRLDALEREIAGIRQLIRGAAVAVDASPGGLYLASAAKSRAATVAQEATAAALGFFGPGARLEHPLLDKMDRDALGVEFMEGTANIHKLTVFQQLVKDRARHVRS